MVGVPLLLFSLVCLFAHTTVLPARAGKQVNSRNNLQGLFGLNTQWSQSFPDQETVNLASTVASVIRTDVFFQPPWRGEQKETLLQRYEKLADSLLSSGIRPYFILGINDARVRESIINGGNESAEDAFIIFCGDVMRALAGRRVIWELWNEPNNVKQVKLLLINASFST